MLNHLRKTSVVYARKTPPLVGTRLGQRQVTQLRLKDWSRYNWTLPKLPACRRPLQRPSPPPPPRLERREAPLQVRWVCVGVGWGWGVCVWVCVGARARARLCVHVQVIKTDETNTNNSYFICHFLHTQGLRLSTPSTPGEKKATTDPPVFTPQHTTTSADNPTKNTACTLTPTRRPHTPRCSM